MGDRRKIVKKLSMFGTKNIDNNLTIYRIVEKLRKLMVIKFRNLIKKICDLCYILNNNC